MWLKGLGATRGEPWVVLWGEGVGRGGGER